MRHRVAHRGRHVEIGAGERAGAFSTRELSAGAQDALALEGEFGELAAHGRHGIGHQHHPLGPLGGDGDLEAGGGDMVEIDDQSAPARPILQRGAHRPGIAAGQRRHGVVEMGEAGEPQREGLADRLVVRCRMAGGDNDSGLHEAADVVGRDLLRRQGHERPPGAERRQDRQILGLQGPDHRRGMDAAALDIEEGPLDMDAEQPRQTRGQACAHGGDGLGGLGAGVADQGHHESRGAEAPMGGADRGDAIGGRHIVELDSAAAIDLDIDEARRQQALEMPAGQHGIHGIGRQHGLDPPAFDHHRMAAQQLLAVEEPFGDEDLGHQLSAPILSSTTKS